MVTAKKKKAKKYVLRSPGSNYRDPQEIGEAIDALEKQLGEPPTTEDVVKAAKLKRSPLHKYFEWDDSKAAHHFRIKQASSLLLCFVEIEDDTETELKKYRANTSRIGIRGTQEKSHIKSYFTREQVFENKDYRDQYVERAKHELEKWVGAYEDVPDKKLKALVSGVKLLLKG